jgi:hypothetical protein
VFSTIKISVDGWHSRLGHPSSDIVHCVISKNNLPCSQLSRLGQSVCDACACAKAHQLPYSMSTSRASAPLELMFSDVWVQLLIPLVTKIIMSASLMNIANSLGLIYFVISLRCPNIFLSFKSLLNKYLIARS